MPVSTGCTPAETIFPIDVLPSSVWREVACDAIPAAVCRGCVAWPGNVCWAETEECKAGVPAAGELVAVMTGLGRGAADELDIREKDDRGADNLAKVGATVGELSASTGTPAAKLMDARAELRTGARGETRDGTPTILGWDEIREGELPVGDAKLPGNFSKAEMFGLLGNAEFKLFDGTGMTLGVLTRLLAGVDATNGEFTAATHDCLTGGCGKTGA